mmetsp:Transcript_13284/g.42902  ORF Transcript_13284/g.42902 Transcript_13284/m.42902 type:complete len:229 (+) Transcript_13284:47-733(+)
MMRVAGDWQGIVQSKKQKPLKLKPVPRRSPGNPTVRVYHLCLCQNQGRKNQKATYNPASVEWCGMGDCKQKSDGLLGEIRTLQKSDVALHSSVLHFIEQLLEHLARPPTNDDPEPWIRQWVHAAGSGARRAAEHSQSLEDELDAFITQYNIEYKLDIGTPQVRVVGECTKSQIYEVSGFMADKGEEPVLFVSVPGAATSPRPPSGPPRRRTRSTASRRPCARATPTPA